MKKLAKILMTGASPVLVLMMGTAAYAQSTGTMAVEEVTVTENREISGIMKPITVPKERSTITQDFINTEPAGQSIFESLNKVPGFNFTNADPYGNSGGNVRIHGFDGNRISGAFDAATPEAKAFTIRCLAEAASMLRDMMADAWRASGKAMLGYKTKASIADLEAGKIDPRSLN